MKLKSRVIEIAGVGLLVAFASSSSFAQGAVERGVNAAGKAVGDVGRAVGDAVTPGPGPWTTNNVTAAQPFGTIDVSGAGSSTDSVRIWSQGRTASERNELSGRCGIINAPANASRYPANAQQFCRNYLTASATPAPGSAPKSN
jgi:hypothetical protein